MKGNRLVTSQYTKYNFLPINLYRQLSKVTNVFFLFTMMLLAIPSISPFTPYTYIIAFLCVLGVSMLKDAYEDYNRHSYDRAFNEKPAYVLKTGEHSRVTVEKIFTEDLEVGCFVVVKEDSEVPADTVFLSSKCYGDRGKVVCSRQCFVETSNLDGEVNYKKKRAHSLPFEEACNTFAVCGEFVICTCDMNSLARAKEFTVFDTGGALSDFECQLMTSNENIMHYERNVLLRGSKLKNTKQIFGLVVSTGQETKLSRSGKRPPAKTSNFEKSLFKKIFYVLLIYFSILVISSLLGALFLAKKTNAYLYIPPYPAKTSLEQTLTEFVLYNYLVPISLFVTFELIRFMQGQFINNDAKMVSRGLSANCRNTNTIEDLGTVECVLADKTGTLTKNEMEFRYVHFVSSNELSELGPFVQKHSDSFFSAQSMREVIGEMRGDQVKEILFLLSVLCCNSVELMGGKYQGASQDEVCIMQELRKNGLCLVKRLDNSVLLDLRGNTVEIDIPMVLEFSSVRQRMSVAAHLFGRHFVLAKGSDQRLLGSNDRSHIRRIIDQNSEFRSLVVCYRELSAQEFGDARRRYAEAIARHEMDEIDTVFEGLERNLDYLGATFIEDKLQENARETILSLSAAGIKFWMITGDKKETAVSCAINCGILDKDFEARSTGVAVDAEELLSTQGRFGEVFAYRSAVVFRASPDHKAKIAQSVICTGKTTLSIGDGNNDVLMLQTTHIGVGMKGKEGTQACVAADVAIPDFQCLKRLLLVHGRNNYTNLCIVSTNSFSKNLLLILIQFYYDFFNGSSGNPIYNYYFLNYFNIFFTSLIPFYTGVFNKEYPDEYLLAHPEKYREARSQFSNRVFLLKIAYAVVEASVIFWLAYGIVVKKDFVAPGGYLGGYKAMNNFFSFVVFFVVILRQVLDISFYAVYLYGAVALSILAYFVTIFGLQEIDYAQKQAVINLYSIPMFYVAIVSVVSIAYLVDYIYEVILKRMLVEDVKKMPPTNAAQTKNLAGMRAEV